MKKNNPSTVFLALAIVAFLSTGISLVLFSHIPWIWKATLAISGVSFVAFVVNARRSIGVALTNRSVRYGINSVLMSVVVLAIVVVINLIASNHDVKKDVTKNKLHTLSDQTVKVLKGLTSDVKLRVFASPVQAQEFDPIFDKYTYYTDKVKVEYVDVDRDPIAVEQNKIKQAGTILVESETRTARIEKLGGAEDPKAEEKITNAIIQVAKGEKKKAYFLTGHGERLTSDSGREGFSEIKGTLEDGRFTVADLSLIEQGDVPKDADLVVIAAPRTQFMEAELKALESYLQGGGHLLVMLEPNSSESIKPLLAKYGVDWKYNKAVVETNRLQQLADNNPLTPIVNSYDVSHDITKDTKQLTIYPVATPIEKQKDIPMGLTVTSLFSTSDRSFEVNLKGNKVVVNQQTDRRGPISLALAVSGKPPAKEAEKGDKTDDGKPEAAPEKKDRELRLVVVGDADFASNGVRNFGINADLFQNMLSWLSNEEDLISIRPRPTDTSEFEITAQRASIINLVSIFLAPFAMFVAGVAVWLSRRRK